eukprot:gene32789-33855_t
MSFPTNLASRSTMPRTNCVRISAKHVAPRPRSPVPSPNPIDTAKATAAAVLASTVLLFTPFTAAAVGLESIELPGLPTGEMHVQSMKDQAAKNAAEDEAFKNSGTMKRLMEQSEANRAKNKKDVENKYCYR